MGLARHTDISFGRQPVDRNTFAKDSTPAMRVDVAAGPWDTSKTLDVSNRATLAFDIAQNFLDKDVTNMAGHYSRLPDSVLIEVEKKSTDLVRSRRTSGVILTSGLGVSLLGMVGGGFYGFSEAPVLAALGAGAAANVVGYLKYRFASAAMDTLEKSVMNTLRKVDAIPTIATSVQESAIAEDKKASSKPQGYRPAFRF